MPTKKKDPLAPVRNIITKWDAGELVNSIEMSGMGPGYEQAIQVAAIEFLRAALRAPEPLRRTHDWEKHCNETLTKIDDALSGVTGAQFHSAVHLAAIWYFEGGEEGLNAKMRSEGKVDRMTLISRTFVDADAVAKANT